MVKKEVTIEIEGGMQARNVAMFVQEAGGHDSTIMVEYEGKRVNAKSIMGMMSLSLAEGEKITIKADGPDEEEALASMAKFVSGKE